MNDVFNDKKVIVNVVRVFVRPEPKLKVKKEIFLLSM